jgi:hypothetical protein
MKTVHCLLAIALIGGSCATAAHAENWTFPAKAGELLEVDLAPGGSVEIHGVAGSTVTVEATASGRDAADYRFTAARTSRGVEVRAEMAHAMRSYSVDAEVSIGVPDHFDLDLSSAGGGFKIVGVEGKINGATQGGSIELERVRGRISIETMGGSVEARDVDASGKVTTMGGNVDFVNVRGGLEGKTMGGSIHIQGGEAVELATMGGAIEIERTPPGAKLSTMGGRIEIGSAIAPLSATTMGGDVSVKVTGGSGDVTLSSMGGDLEVWLPAGFPADFEVDLVQTRGSDGRYKIDSDFELARTREDRTRSDRGWGDRETHWKARGTNGSGGSRIKLSTVNGDIKIHRGG